MQLSLKEIYKSDKVIEVDTTNLTIRRMVKEVARIVDLGENDEFDVHKRLKKLAGN